MIEAVQIAMIAVSPGMNGIIVAWAGPEIAHEVMVLGIDMCCHCVDAPESPGLWVWEGRVDPPFLPQFVEDEEQPTAPLWHGTWRRPTEQEMLWYGMYGRNPWEQVSS